MASVQHIFSGPHVQTFCFGWTLENYSVLRGRDKIVSDPFTVDGPQKTKWELWIYPKGDETCRKTYKTYMSIGMKNISDEDDLKVTAVFSFAIGSADEYVRDEGKGIVFSKSTLWTCHDFIDTQVLKERSSELIPHDVLTLFCTGKMMVQCAEAKKSQTDVRGGLAEDLHSLQSMSDKDVTLVVEKDNSKVHVHRVILCARSSVFADMFENIGKVRRSRKVLIQGFSSDAVRGMVHFMYTDQAPEHMTDDLAMEMMTAAEQYQIPRLKSVCEVHLASSLTKEKVTDLLVFAIKLNSPALKKACSSFVGSHMDEVLDTEAWKKCSLAEVRKAVCCYMMDRY